MWCVGSPSSVRFSWFMTNVLVRSLVGRRMFRGACSCAIVRLSAPPPLTVWSITMYRIPARSSNRTPSKTSSTTGRL